MSDTQTSRGLVVWFTGLSGAGKSALSAALAVELRARDLGVEVLDGDEIRAALWPELGFSRADRDTSVSRMANLAARFADHGLVVLVAAISPYADARADARASIGAERFVEVWATCSLETLAARDVKGLYKKAAAGEIAQFTGVSDPYEPPKKPDVVTDSDAHTLGESLETVLEIVLNRLPEGATK